MEPGIDCGKWIELMIKELQGNLAQDLSNRLHKHMDSCKLCRAEYGDLKWLAGGLRQLSADLEGAHIPSLLLFKYAVQWEKLEGDVIDLIEQHLSSCSDCRKDLETTAELASIDLGYAAEGANREPPRSKRPRLLSRRKHLLAYPLAGAAIVVSAALVIYFFVLPLNRQGIDLVSADSLKRSGYMIKELVPIRVTRSAEKQAAKVTKVTSAESAKIVLGIELGMIREDAKYTAKLLRDSGQLIWQKEIDRELLAAGSLWISLGRKKHEPGLYYLEVTELTAERYEAIVVRAAFRIVR